MQNIALVGLQLHAYVNVHIARRASFRSPSSMKKVVAATKYRRARHKKNNVGVLPSTSSAACCCTAIGAYGGPAVISAPAIVRLRVPHAMLIANSSLWGRASPSRVRASSPTSGVRGAVQKQKAHRRRINRIRRRAFKNKK